MRRTLLLVGIALSSPAGIAHADEGAAPVAAPIMESGRRVDLPTLLAMVKDSPKQQMAQADVAAARAQLSELKSLAGPKLTALAYLAPSPDVDCLNAECTITDPVDALPGHQGLAAGVQLQLIQPIASFGKVGPARRAAQAGIEARLALADASSADLMLDVARAYWGLKFAREVSFFLQDGLDELEKAKTRLQERIASGDPDVTPLDERRVETLMAEASMQQADALAAERTALSAIRIFAGDQTLDIDTEPLQAGDDTLEPLATWMDRAVAHRPELRAAKAGSRAMKQLVTLQERMLMPNMAAVVGYKRSGASSPNPPSFFANDPYNNELLTAALVLQWTVDPFGRSAKTKAAKAASLRADAQASAAEQLVSIEMAAVHAEAEAALARMTASRVGEKSARAWLVGVVQADAVGAAETKDFADAYLAYFTMRTRAAQAIFLWNFAKIRLKRAAGILRDK